MHTLDNNVLLCFLHFVFSPLNPIFNSYLNKNLNTFAVWKEKVVVVIVKIFVTSCLWADNFLTKILGYVSVSKMKLTFFERYVFSDSVSACCLPL